ncbi:MAG: hypothetical protein IIA05_12700 [Proteobacteria bacterium]|nr:hypothetical protein [Pseudomonadota bacterium]
MQTTQELIQALSDSQVIEVTKELFNIVYKQVSYAEVRSNSERVAEVDALVTLDSESLKQEMSAAESVHFGRLVLKEYAGNPELAPFVRQAWEKVESSDDLIVGVILALGVVINLTLLMATTSVKMKKDASGTVTWDIGKKQAGLELVKAVINPLVDVAKLGTA